MNNTAAHNQFAFFAPQLEPTKVHPLIAGILASTFNAETNGKETTLLNRTAASLLNTLQSRHEKLVGSAARVELSKSPLELILVMIDNSSLTQPLGDVKLIELLKNYVTWHDAGKATATKLALTDPGKLEAVVAELKLSDNGAIQNALGYIKPEPPTTAARH